MARAPYQVCERDKRFIISYIQRKLATEMFWLSDNHQAQAQWHTAQRDPVTIQQWCEHWLSDQQWQQLKAAVRAARRRAYRRDDPPVNVTLSRRAWQVVADLARDDGMTLSQWLIKQHYQRWVRQDPDPIEPQ